MFFKNTYNNVLKVHLEHLDDAASPSISPRVDWCTVSRVIEKGDGQMSGVWGFRLGFEFKIKKLSNNNG